MHNSINNNKGFNQNQDILNIKRHQNFLIHLEQVDLKNSESCIQVLKARMLKFNSKAKKTWNENYYHLRLKKYEKNPKIELALSTWFNSEDFSFALKNFNGLDSNAQAEIFGLAKVKIKDTFVVPKPKGFFNSNQEIVPKEKLDLKTQKLKLITSRTNEPPEKYLQSSMHRLYQIFPTKISILETDKCVNLLKIRVCNLLLKKNWQIKSINWEMIENSIGTRNYNFENPQIGLKLKEWCESEQFALDFSQFSADHTVNSHPDLNLKIQLTPKQDLLKHQVETVKSFIFELLLKQSKPNEKLWVANLLTQNLDYLNFVSKNNYSKSVLTQISKWYHSELFDRDLELFQTKGFKSSPSSKQKGLERFKMFQNLKLQEKTINWFQLVQTDLDKLFKNKTVAQQENLLEIKDQLKMEFDSRFSNSSKIIRLNQEQIEKENMVFQQISNEKDFSNWLNNSASISNQILAWWAEKLSFYNKPSIGNEFHHIMPRYMKNYGVSENNILNSFNLISLTPEMHNLIHAIRFLEFGFQEDFNVINRLHHNLRDGKLIQEAPEQTVLKILENCHLFQNTIRKGKFINLPETIQQLFTRDMVWRGICNYQLKTLVVPANKVASYLELISYLNQGFNSEKSFSPSESQIGAMRKYLNGQRSSLGNLAWQLDEIAFSEAITPTVNTYQRYTLWQYLDGDTSFQVLMPPVSSSTNLVKMFEDYQGFTVEPAKKKSLARLVSKRTHTSGETVLNWQLINKFASLKQVEAFIN